jgi:mono/diheme cytochrome c family protein
MRRDGNLLVLALCMAGLLAEPASSKAAPATVPAAPPASVDKVLAWDAQSKETTVKAGDKEAHFTFSLTNISQADVTISNVTTSCGCTVARLPMQPWTLAPGTNGQINVTMNLMGKSGSVIKGVTIHSDKGMKMVFVKVNIPPPPPPAPMSAVDRVKNQIIATTDRQAVFKGDCAKCHAEPAQGKTGKELYAAVCGICHETSHRATMTPNLHAIAEATGAEFWSNWISQGKPGSLMPAFAKTEGGVLDAAQIASLVSYLTQTIPSRPAASTAQPPSAAQ